MIDVKVMNVLKDLNYLQSNANSVIMILKPLVIAQNFVRKNVNNNLFKKKEKSMVINIQMIIVVKV